MFVRRLQDLKGSDQEIDGGNWISRRLVLARDKMGFSVHDTIIKAGGSMAGFCNVQNWR
jgi:L-ectoine synthase